MGIRGLNKYLRTKAPLARKSFQPTRGFWAIDTSCILYRARGAGLHLPTVIASLIVRLRKAGGEPIFVFDGATPTAKTEVVEQRRVTRVATQKEMASVRAELTGKADRPEGERADLEVKLAALQKKAPSVAGAERDAVKQLLHAAGALFVTATAEADDLLAFLARRGIVEGVISTDMDMLPRGVGCLVTPETPDCSVLTETTLVRTCSFLGLPYERFVDACQLMGSDYTPAGFQTLDPAAAIAAVKQRDFVLPAELAEGAALLRGDGVVLESLLSEKQLVRWRSVQTVETERLVEIAGLERWPRDWLTALGASSQYAVESRDA
jgi:hypothetical protein